MQQTVLHSLFVMALLFIFGCRESVKADSKGPVIKIAEQKEKIKVTNITFVGKKNACDCTRERIEMSWKALQEALKGHKEISIKRIQLDVDTEETEKLKKIKTFVVPPALYFLSPKKQLVQLLQGEVTMEQIKSIID